MSQHTIPLFKSWVSEWLARSIIFLIVITCLMGFALYYSNAENAIGHFGMDPYDVQYSVVLMYAAVVCFLALDSRLVKYFSPIVYLSFALLSMAISYIICFYTQNFFVFQTCRFVQGMDCALISSVALNLIFPRLKTERARVIGYTVFYGGLLTSIPICAIYCSVMVQYFDFNYIFYGLAIAILPMIALIFLTMNSKARFTRKLPLYQVDWIGFLFYLLFCCLFGYVMVYGIQLNWLDSISICIAIVVLTFSLLLFIVRQWYLKRPLINLQVFAYRNFRIGLLLLVLFYILKGTSGFTFSYLEVVLGVDPIHLIPIWLFNIVGIVIAMFVTARFVLSGTSFIRIIIVGFALLGLFHWMMYRSFSSNATTNDFLFPILVFGAGTGTLFVPIVMFALSSVPPKIAYNVSFVGILFRFIGFCISTALSNYFQLYTRSNVYLHYREHTNTLNIENEVAAQRMSAIYLNTGIDKSIAHDQANNMLSEWSSRQIIMKSAMDYYGMILVAIIVVIALLIAIPSLQKVVLRVRKTFTPY